MRSLSEIRTMNQKRVDAMYLANQILDAIREYEVAFGRKPTHVSMNGDEIQQLSRELGRPVVPGQKVFDVEVREVDAVQTGVHMIRPV